MFEGPFGQSPGQTTFAEPNNDRAMRFIQRWSSNRPSTPSALVCCVRAREVLSVHGPLFGEFFDEVSEFRKDQLFHGQADRIF